MSKLSRYNLLSTTFNNYSLPRHTLNGVDAVPENEIIIQKALFHFMFLIEDLLTKKGLNQHGRDTRISQFFDVVNCYDFSIVINSLKGIYDLLLDHISQKRVITSYKDFKGLIESKSLLYDGRLLSPIKEDISAVLIATTFVRNGVYQTTCGDEMKNCSAYLLFLSKLNFKAVGLEDAALDDYLACEGENELIHNWQKSDSIINALHCIIKDWCTDWYYDKYRDHHGSGSVADTSKGTIYKYLSLKSDPKLCYALMHSKVEEHKLASATRTHTPLRRESKLIFVPKNISKLRSISMEPATLQYHQQGVLKSLMSYFKTHRELRNILHLDDQSWNQSYAYDGSLTDCYSTIDLSHASDSVTWNLVKRLFKGTELMRWLWCTRSTHTLLPTGHVISLTKFAPMGSALCFPIESLIFAAIAKLATKIGKEQGLDVDCDTGVHSKYVRFVVYGDDIILPSYASAICINLLKHCGFTPNESKSYLHGPFKESCGVNFFCGVDITPIKFSPKYKLEAVATGYITPEAYMSLCSLANLAYEHQHSMLRLSFIKELLNNGFRPLFSDSVDCSPAIYSPTPTNFHLRSRYEKDKRLKTDYQRFSFEYDNIGLECTLKVPTLAYRALLNRTRYYSWWDNIPAYSSLSNGFCRETATFDNDTRVSDLSMQTTRVVITRCRNFA